MICCMLFDDAIVLSGDVGRRINRELESLSNFRHLMYMCVCVCVRLTTKMNRLNFLVVGITRMV